jgi:hypothetical protein
MQHKNIDANQGIEILLRSLWAQLKNHSNQYKLPNRQHPLLTKLFKHLPLVSWLYIKPLR